ncbi:MFS transporter [Rhodococcus jostii]|uniref:MFS transporter n=1 Tax=Rhodococcus jostii TaxID=132919 RepID=UPI00362C97E9
MRVTRTRAAGAASKESCTPGRGVGPSATKTELDRLYRKIALRLLPFLFVAYIVNSIDRVNISFAKLRMMDDLGLSTATYGLGASLFFVGYVLFEVPSNLYMQRIGARATVMRIMILWGLITVATGFVTAPTQLYILRFLLGAAEAGFFPCIILYLTYWFPAARRGRITSMFVLAVPTAGILSGPLATWIMNTFDGAHGLHGWQVLFVYEGIPAVLLGILAWFLLPDGPTAATWLTERERAVTISAIESEQASRTAPAMSGGVFRQLLTDKRVYIAGFVFFAMYAGFNVFSYWTPTLLEGLGIDDLTTIGMLSTLPAIGAVIGMIVNGRSSDRRLERRFHVAVPLLIAGICFGALLLTRSNVLLSMILLTTAATMCFGTLPVFWTVPPSYLSPVTAAVGIALISSIGGVAAFITPNLIGQITVATGSIHNALLVVGALLIVAAVVMVKGIPARVLQEHRAASTTHTES